MPTLPLPPLENGVPLDAGRLAVSSTTDVSQEWSQDLMQSQSAPVRDAIIQGQTDMSLEYQRASRYAAAQNDPLRATDEYLQEIGAERGITKRQGETDASYRARINAEPTTVDPNDIIAVANAILAPYTAISCRYAERSDGCFASAGDSSWSCHAFESPDDNVPNYPDRLYALQSPAPAVAIPNRRPPGMMANGDSYARWFLLRAPDISPVDTTVAAAYAGDVGLPPQSGFFASGTIASDGVNAGNATFAYNFTSTVDAIYGALVGAVEAIRMHGVRWTLMVDPILTP